MTTLSLDAVERMVDQLSSEDKARLVQRLVTQLDAEKVAVSALGMQLRALRAEIVANGTPLLDRDELQVELAERRGER